MRLHWKSSREHHGNICYRCFVGGGMAYLYRIIICWLFLFGNSAFASIPPVSQSSWMNISTGQLIGPNVLSFWVNWIDTSYGPGNNPTCSAIYISNDRPTISCGSNFNYQTYRDYPVLACSANSTLAGAACNCNAGYAENAGHTACISIQAQNNESCKALADGLNYADAPLIHFGSPGLTACFGGFVLDGQGSVTGGGQTELYGPFKCSGVDASACAVVTKPSSITVTCAPGSFPGTVNGVSVCVPPSSSISGTSTTTAAPPAGSASGTVPPPIDGAPAGTVSQSTSTACTNGSCTTTTNNFGSSGASLGQTSETKPQLSFCSENPTAVICKGNDSSFSGDCTSPPVCKGDAVTCAIAAQTLATKCALTASSAESSIYDSEKAKLQTGIVPRGADVSLGVGSFSQADNIGTAGGLSDMSITVWHTDINIPFSNLNQYLSYLGSILMAVAFITSIKIIRT